MDDDETTPEPETFSVEQSLRLAALQAAVDSAREGTTSNDLTEGTTNNIIARAAAFEDFLITGDKP